MSIEQNKSIVRKYAELTNARDLDAAFAHFSPSFVDHAVRPGMPPGIEGTRLFFNMMFTAFPDLRATIQDIIAEGDKVVARVSWRGTHTGDFQGLPPTGKQIVIGAFITERLKDGKAVEHWSLFDQLAMMQQLGLVPSPQAGK